MSKRYSSSSDLCVESPTKAWKENDQTISSTAPPLPSSEPPKLGFNEAIDATDEEDSIKKALVMNMKSIENWKIEQEILMKVTLKI